VRIHTLSLDFNQVICLPTVAKTRLWKAVALAAGLALGALSYPVHATTVSGGDTVRELYDALLSTMKNGHTLGKSGRLPNWYRSFTAASTSPGWPDCRSARLGAV